MMFPPAARVIESNTRYDRPTHQKSAFRFRRVRLAPDRQAEEP